MLAADDILGPVAADRGEGRVDRQDAALGVGDGDALLAALEDVAGQVQLAGLLFEGQRVGVEVALSPCSSPIIQRGNTAEGGSPEDRQHRDDARVGQARRQGGPGAGYFDVDRGLDLPAREGRDEHDVPRRKALHEGATGVTTSLPGWRQGIP